MKSKIEKMLESYERERRKVAGFFDGRFRSKVIPSKKKYKRNKFVNLEK